MSNDVTTSDGGAPVPPPTSRRRALWVATGVAGLTGVVGLAALGGLAARDNKSDDPKRVAENHAVAPQNASDAGKADGKDADKDKRDDESGKDGKDRGWGEWGEHGEVRAVPCDDEELVEAIDLANRGHGGTLELAEHCTYELSFADKKSGTALPTIKQDVTIKGNDATIKRDSEDAFRLFRVADGGELTLKDLTVKDGNAAEFKYGGAPAAAPALTPAPPGPGQPPKGDAKDEGEGDGGALLVERGGSAHLVQVKLTGNNAENDGGAIANFGRVDLKDSKVHNNHAQGDGGGIFNTGLLKIKDTEITDNTAGGSGGGIANGHDQHKNHGPSHLSGIDGGKDYWVKGRDDAGTVEIIGSHEGKDRDKSLIEGNTADHNGGGLFSSRGTVTITFTTIKNNTACDSGGGIYAKNTDLKLDHVTIANNHASKDGGGLVNTGGENHKPMTATDSASASAEHRDHDQEATATVSDSWIVENTAGRFGGGIFNGDQNAHIVEGFPQDQHGTDDNATLTLRNTEIKGNTALNGGGIFNNKGTVTLNRTHVTKNTATDPSKTHRAAGGILNNEGTVRLDDESTITNNDPTNCAGTVTDCFN